MENIDYSPIHRSGSLSEEQCICSTDAVVILPHSLPANQPLADSPSVSPLGRAGSRRMIRVHVHVCARAATHTQVGLVSSDQPPHLVAVAHGPSLTDVLLITSRIQLKEIKD